LIAATDASTFFDAALTDQPQPPSVAADLAPFIFGTSATPTLPTTFEPSACDWFQTKFQLVVKIDLPSVKILRASPVSHVVAASGVIFCVWIMSIIICRPSTAAGESTLSA